MLQQERTGEGLKLVAMGNHFSSLTCSEWSDLGATYPIADDRGTSFWTEFGNGVVPRNVLLDSGGVVRYNATGFNEADISTVLDQLLGVSSAETPTVQPQAALLLRSYPNPFNAGTHFRFTLKESGPISLHIYNARGAVVFSWNEDRQPAGETQFIWTGLDDSGAILTSGVYFARLETHSGSSMLKLLLLK